MKNKYHIVVAILLFLVAGCSMLAERPESEGRNYYAVLERWTGGAKVYKGVDVILEVDVVYMGREFKTAYVEEYAARLGMDEDRKKRMLERELEKLDEYNELILVAATPVEEWNDFESRRSIWRLYLVDEDGESVEPLEIKRLDRDAFLREFFPFVDEWSTVYRVTFPRLTPKGHTIGEGSQYIRLKISGIKGSTELLWNLKEQ